METEALFGFDISGFCLFMVCLCAHQSNNQRASGSSQLFQCMGRSHLWSGISEGIKESLYSSISIIDAKPHFKVYETVATKCFSKDFV